MHPPLRIAVLECDSPIGRTKEKYGGYGNLFRDLLENGAKALAERHSGEPPQLDITTFDVVHHEHYPSLENVDAVLLTGSRFDSFENDPWIVKLVEFTKQVLRQDRVRLIGICFGHQIIGRAMDVGVGRADQGWEISVTKVDLTPRGQDLFGLNELAIHQMHRDIVYAYPAHVESLGSTDRCSVQGMYVKNRLVSVQGHPEFNCDVVTELLETRHEKGIFDNAMFQDGMDRVQKHHDGIAVAAGFIQFLLDD